VTTIKTLVLRNFKKFDNLELNFNVGTNTLIGDNEAGKSTVLLAIDLVLGASRSRVEAIGIETLFARRAIETFLAGPKKLENLPTMFVEVWFEEGKNFELNGKSNSKNLEADGLRMDIAPVDDYGKAILEVLADEHPNFPFEYYGIKFSTFSGDPLLSFKRPLTHLALDSSKIDSDHAAREYTRAVFGLHADTSERHKLENQYRRGKDSFRNEYLGPLNRKLSDYQFSVRSGSRSNLEVDLVITEDNIPLESRGKGRQCFLKTQFALSKHKVGKQLHVLLLEEPENHLSHTNMKKLVQSLASADHTQLIVATHSSHISSRLDLRHALLLGTGNKSSSLRSLTPATADFFIKAPDNNVLEFALSKKVILVEGDAEFILLDALYRKVTGGASAEHDNVHVIAIGGTSFKRYLELGKLLGIRTAAIRDNDGSFQKNCVDNYAEHTFDDGQVFSDTDDTLSTFEKSLYACNTKNCDEVFAAGRKKLSVLEYMISNKADAALELLTKKGDDLEVPAYISEAITWIRA